MAEQDATAQPAAAQPQPQSFDDVFKEPATQSFDDLFKPRAASMLPEPPLSLDADQWKTYLNEAPVGRIISAFGNAFTGPGFSEEATEKMRELGIFNDVSKAQKEHTDSFAQGIVRPIITGARSLAEGIARPFIGGLDTIQRAIEGAENVAAETGKVLEEPGLVRIPGAGQIGSDVAGMIEEAATFGHIVPEGGIPRLPPEIAEPRATAVIGEGEQGYFDTKAPSDEELQARTAAAAQVAPEVTAETPAPATPAAQEAAEPAPAPTIHDIARQTEPDLFREYDALQARRDTFVRWMRELPDQTRVNIEANPPEALRTLDDQIAATERKLENAGARRRGDFQDQLDALHDQRADLVEDLMRNHPDVAQVRKALQDTDNRMRDLAPDVSAAYREAELRAPQTEEIGAAEAAVEPGNEPEPTAASATLLAEAAPSQAPVPETAEAPTTPEAAPPAPTRTVAGPATPEQLQQIADDVTQKLTAAGRPDEEARAAAQIVAAYYDTRAQRFGGKLGTAQEIYAREAPEIQVAERRAVKEPALAQGGRRAVGQMSILKGGRRVIRLFKDADASTFMHETGHAWLEDMLADAEHPLAPDDLKADAAAVKKWLGVEEGSRPTGRQHEKFARGWERYLMEGVAPSRALAGVFAKFKDWLTRIYQTVARLKSPINDDIRDVFDRLLSRAPEKVTLAPEVERPSTMADIHEAEAEHTPPAEAEPVLDKQRTEFATDARARTPELVPELQLEPATEGGPGPAERPSPNGGEPAPGPEFGAAGDLQEPGAVSEGTGEARSEGAAAPAEPGTGQPAGGEGGSRASAADESQRSADAGTADPELIDKAGNIRLDNLNQPEDVDDALRQIAREQNDFQSDRFGPEGRQLHDQILAARKLTAQAMQEMAEARVKAAAENASEEDLLAYKDAADRLTLIARRLSVLTHNWGLAGQAFRSLNGLPESTKMLTMAQLAERTKGMTFNQLKQEAQLGLKLDTPAQQMKFINDLRKSDWDKARSMIIEYFVNNLISGPITHMAYTVGNETANLFRAGVEGPIAAAISAVRGRGIGERIYAGEAKALLYSHTKGAADGWVAAQKAWKTGIAETLPGELEALSPAEQERFEANRVPNTGAIPGKLGEAIRLPSHGVAAIHSFGRAIGAAQELWRLAYRSAADAGLDGEAFDRHVADFIDHPPAGTLEKVNEAASRGVLMQRAQYGTAFYHLKQLTQKNLAAKLVAPFMQIGANLLHEAFLERTPLGLINKDIRDNLMGRNGAIAQDMQTGKMVAGITLSTAVIGLTLNGLVSGGGPSDPKERRVLMATGWQPYSLKVGDRWVPFRKYMGPLGLLVAGAADVAEIGHQLQEGDMLKAAASFVGGFSEVVADESWFRGVSNFINAARNYDKPEAERYLRDLATDFIPYSVGLSQVARTVDPYSRQVRTLVDSVKAHTPGVSETLFPRRDILGEPIPSRLMTSPSAVRDEPVLDAMLKAEYYPSTLGRKIRGVELTDQQYDDFQRIAGRMAKVTIRSMVDQPDWNALPVNLRHRMIQDAFTHARERARSTVIAQSLGSANDIAKAALHAKVKRLSDVGAE